MPTYRYDIRAGDLQTWVEVLEEIGEFDGHVDPSDLVVGPTADRHGVGPDHGSAPVALGG